MSVKPIAVALVLALPLYLASMAAHAASVGNAVSSSSGTASKSTDFTAGETAAMDGNFEAAVGYLSKVVNTDPTNADGYNLLGFSYRKLGNVELAFENYRAALEIEPNHQGANEYIGELYLQLGDLANAEKHLKVLDEACFFGCQAYTDLKTAIKKFKLRQGG
jgi:Flp pilus assembly protein TadD